MITVAQLAAQLAAMPQDMPVFLDARGLTPWKGKLVVDDLLSDGRFEGAPPVEGEGAEGLRALVLQA